MRKQEEYIFTSESVTEGHPDKICDQVSDTVLDRLLADDPKSRVACETMVTGSLVIVSGEVTSSASLNVSDITREVVRKIGYTKPEYGFDCETATVLSALQKQSPDIAMGVDTGGAGDQGLMFGYACDETPELMPLPIQLAHELASRLSHVRKEDIVSSLRPDGKSQVSVRYDKGVPVEVQCVVLAAQHDPDIDVDGLREKLTREVIMKVIPEKFRSGEMKIFINPTGLFVRGGPVGDTGLTGRKIIVDTYGGFARHGGGAFSGKDPSKVDRSASYMARYLAKNIVASGCCNRCEIQIAYAIGEPQPVSLSLETWGTEKVPVDRIIELIRDRVDLSPAAIIQKLDLLKPRFSSTAAYGHFGRKEPEFTWEATDMVDDFRSLL